MLKGMMDDRVALVKQDGTRHEDIPANVQPKKIFIDDASVPVEEGDRISRTLPNGLVESYLVLDRGFYEKFGGIPAHYQIEVRKESRPPDPSRAGATVIYNLHGANSRVNVHSIDSSTNVVDATPDVVFERLRAALREAVAEETSRQELLKAVAKLEANQGGQGFVGAYKEFITLAAAHMSVLSPFIPALTQMLK
jgi:hypothetical protein